MVTEVIETYTAQYDDPISFDAGVAVQVLHGDSEFRGWFWCRAPSGKEGWVHQSFLDDAAGTTKSTQAYSARELSVSGGERGCVLRWVPFSRSLKRLRICTIIHEKRNYWRNRRI